MPGPPSPLSWPQSGEARVQGVDQRLPFPPVYRRAQSRGALRVLFRGFQLDSRGAGLVQALALQASASSISMLGRRRSPAWGRCVEGVTRFSR